MMWRVRKALRTAEARIATVQDIARRYGRIADESGNRQLGYCCDELYRAVFGFKRR